MSQLEMFEAWRNGRSKKISRGCSLWSYLQFQIASVEKKIPGAEERSLWAQQELARRRV